MYTIYMCVYILYIYYIIYTEIWNIIPCNRVSANDKHRLKPSLSISFIPIDVHLRVAELGNDSAQELVFLPGVGKKMTAVKVVRVQGLPKVIPRLTIF